MRQLEALTAPITRGKVYATSLGTELPTGRMSRGFNYER